MAAMTMEKSRMKKIGESNKENEQIRKKNSVVSVCPNPFKLDEMDVSLTDTKTIEGSGEDAIEIHNLRLTTASDEDMEKVACKYQMYCAVVQAQAYEGFLGSNEKFTDLENELAKQTSEYNSAT